MGCDVHVFIEYKRKEEGSQWRSHGKEIKPNRNYLMFGILAGVRSQPSLQFEPKGLPENYGNEVKEAAFDFVSGIWVAQSDWHTYSWLSLKEYKEVIEFYNTTGHWKEVEYEAILATLESFDNNGNESRIVFWFDN